MEKEEYRIGLVTVGEVVEEISRKEGEEGKQKNQATTDLEFQGLEEAVELIDLMWKKEYLSMEVGGRELEV